MAHTDREIVRAEREFKQRNGPWRKRLRNHYRSVYLPPAQHVNVRLLSIAVKYTRLWVKTRTTMLRETDSRLKICEQTARLAWDQLVALSTHPLPYQPSVLQSLVKEPAEWTAPSFYLEYRTCAATEALENSCPQSAVDGCENVWVMKPSFSSRGIGIQCLNSIKEACARGHRVQAKVVQKYVEKPFLLLLPGPKGRMEKRKFDVRQWVLVTSFSPLVVYMFTGCYMKICGSEYSLADLKDKYRHVSNYSVQKGNQRVNDVNSDLIMSSSHFSSYLRENHRSYLSLVSTIDPSFSGNVTCSLGWPRL